MAKGKIKKICGNCGKEFDRYKILKNRTEADKWETWAMQNITICPECYKR